MLVNRPAGLAAIGDPSSLQVASGGVTPYAAGNRSLGATPTISHFSFSLQFGFLYFGSASFFASTASRNMVLLIDAIRANESRKAPNLATRYPAALNCVATEFS